MRGTRVIDDLTAARAFYTSRERRPAMRRGINIAPLLPAKLLSLKFKQYKILQQKVFVSTISTKKPKRILLAIFVN